MKEHRGEAVWQKTPCTRCRTHHPRHCDLCPGGPPCADHVCSWPDAEDDEPLTGNCPECGGKLLWAGMSWERHTEGWHLARRRILLKILRQRLWEEANFRREAQDLAFLYNDVLVLWRIVLPTEILYFRTQLPGELWDGNREFRDGMMAQLGRGLRDAVQEGYGIRPHPIMTKYRVFDERCDRLAS